MKYCRSTKVAWMGFFLACFVLAAGNVDAVVTSSSLHGANAADYDGLLFDDDLINGLSEEPEIGGSGVYVLDQHPITGWHPANNQSPDDQLPAFTDGVGVRSTGLTGLLNDNQVPTNEGPMALSGAPVKIVEYVFSEPTDIGRINILTGNTLNADGRIFMTTSIIYSTDGNIFDDLGYFTSDPSGVQNAESAPEQPFDPAQKSTYTSIFNDSSTTMLTGVTNIEFSFYAVSIFGGPTGTDSGRHVDPYDGVNPYTGEDDGFEPAFISPLVWEIDIVAPATQVVGDYNGDGAVNIADYTVWRNNLGATVPEGTAADGSNNGVVDEDDYAIWKLYFGASDGSATALSTAAVPEPGSHYFVFIFVLFGVTMWRTRQCF